MGPLLDLMQGFGAALTACVVAIDLAGFGIAIFLLLLFLYAVIERLPVLRSAAIAGVTTAVLVLVFKTWLGVPLPVGLMGL